MVRAGGREAVAGALGEVAVGRGFRGGLRSGSEQRREESSANKQFCFHSTRRKGFSLGFFNAEIESRRPWEMLSDRHSIFGHYTAFSDILLDNRAAARILENV